MASSTITKLNTLTEKAHKQMQEASVLQEQLRLREVAEDSSRNNSTTGTAILDKRFRTFFRDYSILVAEVNGVVDNMEDAAGKLATALQDLEEAHYDLEHEVERVTKALGKFSDYRCGGAESIGGPFRAV